MIEIIVSKMVDILPRPQWVNYTSNISMSQYNDNITLQGPDSI